MDIGLGLTHHQDTLYYQLLIGVLRWIVELGQGDLTTEVSMMSSHLAIQREGHLKEVFHAFGNLKKYHNPEIVFDPSIPKVDLNLFPKEDWGYSIYSTRQRVEGGITSQHAKDTRKSVCPPNVYQCQPCR